MITVHNITEALLQSDTKQMQEKGTCQQTVRCTYLSLHATVLQVPSEQRYCPVSQGLMMIPVRVAVAFRLGME